MRPWRRRSIRSGSTTSSTSRTSTTSIKERKRKPPVAAALEGFTDEEVFAEIQSRKQGHDSGTATSRSNRPSSRRW